MILSKSKNVSGFFREYHNWNWDEGDIWEHGGDIDYVGYPNNEMKFAPSEAGGGSWNFDQFYTNCKDNGVAVYPVIQGSVKWLHGGIDFPRSNKPVDEDTASTTNPNSYEAKAHHMYQFAARYGSNAIDDNLLTLASDQPRNSGLGLIKYMEDWNEQDATWHGADGYFSPEEYAAMSSAGYDGHENSMTHGSGTFGIKNADPNMKFVMGGIWELNLQYVKDMDSWYKENRNDGKFVPDVINVHDYAWNTDDTQPALSPEADDFKGNLEEFTSWRDQNYPEKEVWMTEFGWDTHPLSRLRTPILGDFDQEEVQGQWLVRAYLLLSAAGVDRASMFMLRNTNESSSVQFSNCGLTSSKSMGWIPKTSWYYVYTLKNTLTNMRFVEEERTGNPSVTVYKFKDLSSNRGAYVVWCPTSEGKTVSGYTLNISESATKAIKISLKDGDTNGISTMHSISANTVKVNVSESPIFIVVDNID